MVKWKTGVRLTNTTQSSEKEVCAQLTPCHGCWWKSFLSSGLRQMFSAAQHERTCAMVCRVLVASKNTRLKMKHPDRSASCGFLFFPHNKGISNNTAVETFLLHSAKWAGAQDWFPAYHVWLSHIPVSIKLILHPKSIFGVLNTCPLLAWKVAVKSSQFAPLQRTAAVVSENSCHF